MGENRENYLLKGSVIISLCLCSIALCLLADPLVLWEDHHPFGGSGGFPDHSHFDEHEDDFLLTKTASANKQAAEILAKISTHLPNTTHFSSPITPPPKA